LTLDVGMGINANYCPFCKKKAEYHTNPMYHHFCEHCGKEMSLHDLINGVDISEATLRIAKLRYEIRDIRKKISETKEKLK
jgi:predicted amidophosphoribosyltransferase